MDISQLPIKKYLKITGIILCIIAVVGVVKYLATTGLADTSTISNAYTLKYINTDDPSQVIVTSPGVNYIPSGTYTLRIIQKDRDETTSYSKAVTVSRWLQKTTVSFSPHKQNMGKYLSQIIDTSFLYIDGNIYSYRKGGDVIHGYSDPKNPLYMSPCESRSCGLYPYTDSSLLLLETFASYQRISVIDVTSKQVRSIAQTESNHGKIITSTLDQTFAYYDGEKSVTVFPNGQVPSTVLTLDKKPASGGEMPLISLSASRVMAAYGSDYITVGTGDNSTLSSLNVDHKSTSSDYQIVVYDVVNHNKISQMTLSSHPLIKSLAANASFDTYTTASNNMFSMYTFSQGNNPVLVEPLTDSSNVAWLRDDTVVYLSGINTLYRASAKDGAWPVFRNKKYNLSSFNVVGTTIHLTAYDNVVPDQSAYVFTVDPSKEEVNNALISPYPIDQTSDRLITFDGEVFRIAPNTLRGVVKLNDSQIKSARDYIQKSTPGATNIQIIQ